VTEVKRVGVEYTVERHERHIVLLIDGRRWVLRDDEELTLMLQVFGCTGGQEVRDHAFRVLPPCRCRRYAPGSERREH